MLSKILSQKSATNPYSSETVEILRLIRSENVGPKTFYSLIEYYGSARVALKQLPELAKYGGKHKPIRVCSEADAEEELEQLGKMNAKLLTYKDPLYPKLLKQIADAPPVLNYRGNPALFNTSNIAIVGARNASIGGKHFAQRLARDIAEHNITIVSGLARGIDTAAHSVAVDKTVAVIAGGIDHLYPPENKRLYEQIAEEGLIVAELPVGAKPLAKHFPQRNRIISGLSLATVVIEAGLNSGSLITAKFALEQNRDVFAVPGFPLDPRSQGSNRLIKDGAYLLESIEDILLNISIGKDSFEEEKVNDIKTTPLARVIDSKLLNFEARKKIIELLSSYPVEVEILVKESNLPLPIVITIVLELELAGKVIRYPGNKIALKFE